MVLPSLSPRVYLQRHLYTLLAPLPFLTLLLGALEGTHNNVPHALTFLALLGLAATFNGRRQGLGTVFFLLGMPLWLLWFIGSPGFGGTFLNSVTGYGTVLILTAVASALWFPARGVALFVAYSTLAGGVGLSLTPFGWLGLSWFVAVALLVGGTLTWLLGCTDQMVAQLGQAARADALTGLGNRRAFEETLQALWTSHASRLALAIIDVDGLKLVNDEQGHGAGDEVLRLFAQALLLCVPAAHSLFRIGGDEYVVLSLTGDAALLRAELVAAAEQIGRRVPGVGASVGLACGHECAGPEGLLRLADERMYRQKRLKKTARPRRDRPGAVGGPLPDPAVLKPTVVKL
ncbi:GGDEF domain-containing protein [Deinococcus sp. HMF7604]|uniref:GGDEF domain-containing protein n=1 Tax=Deinococcus betulae TaxID=2873312 RepID=UPI001CCAA2A8|nr:GGDEF domain-containing protein [Deinococcus betulae]MBZ9749679.1 GGDEF domain-containing protein [Deinococcus betulae]